jgi:hypothetical protein
MNRQDFHLSKFLSVMICLFISSIPATSAANLRVQALAPFGAPILKWQLGGCYNSWCETGWYSSPATADLDGDGQVEVIASAWIDRKAGVENVLRA